jgi:hypothetical protein
MKSRYWLIYGLNDGRPIRPYVVDGGSYTYDYHIDTHGDMCRNAWGLSEKEYKDMPLVYGDEFHGQYNPVVNLFVRSDGFPVCSFAEFVTASPSCFSLPALAILWKTYGPERLVDLQSDMLNEPIIPERMEDDFTEWTASEVWAAVSVLDYETIEDMAAGVFQDIVDEDIRDADGFAGCLFVK